MANARFIHGDAVLSLRALPDRSVDCVIADPPYSSGGMHRSDKTKSVLKKYVKRATQRTYREFDGDSRDQRAMLAWGHLWMVESYRVTKPGGYFFCFTDWRQLPVMTDAMQSAGFVWRGVIPWNKGRGARAPHKGYARHQCEYVIWGTRGPCHVAHDGPIDGFVEAEEDAPGVIHAKVLAKEKVHATGKPLAVMNELVRLVPRGGVVLDPFMGSAKSCEAALQAGLSFIGIESDAFWVDYAREKFAMHEVSHAP